MVARVLVFRVLVNKHASTGASPAVSDRNAQHLNWRYGLVLLARAAHSASCTIANRCVRLAMYSTLLATMGVL